MGGEACKRSRERGGAKRHPVSVEGRGDTRNDNGCQGLQQSLRMLAGGHCLCTPLTCNSPVL